MSSAKVGVVLFTARRVVVSGLAAALAASVAPVAAFAYSGGSPAGGSTYQVASVEGDLSLVTGRLVSPAGELVDNVEVVAYDDVTGDEVSASITYGGRFELWVPAGAVVRVVGHDLSSPQRWADFELDAVSVDDAKVRLGATPLKFVAPIMMKAPRIKGKVQLKGELKATKGQWTHPEEDITTYAYQWVRGNKVVGKKKTYKLKKRDMGQELALHVTAATENSVPGLANVAVGVPATMFKVAKVKLNKKKVKVRVKLAGFGKQKIQLRSGKKVVASATGSSVVNVQFKVKKKRSLKGVYKVGNKVVGFKTVRVK